MRSDINDAPVRGKLVPEMSVSFTELASSNSELGIWTYNPSKMTASKEESLIYSRPDLRGNQILVLVFGSHLYVAGHVSSLASHSATSRVKAPTY